MININVKSSKKYFGIPALTMKVILKVDF